MNRKQLCVVAILLITLVSAIFIAGQRSSLPHKPTSLELCGEYALVIAQGHNSAAAMTVCYEQIPRKLVVYIQYRGQEMKDRKVLVAIENVELF
ncbi:MAG TPA: hypothetical protein VJB65_03270 [Patescibacteria group bacterium]|nr:hypothetical protein [Patescibacteria group bacterium]